MNVRGIGRTVAAAGALLLCIALAACSAPEPITSPTVTTAQPSPTPTPTPTPAVDPAPTVIDGIDCGAMTVSVRASNFAVRTDFVDGSVLGTPRDAAFAQAGWKRCEWTAGDGTLLDVAVLLGGGPVAPVNWTEGQATTADSTVDCFDASVGVECRGDFVVGADWITIDFQVDSSGPNDPVALLTTVAQQVGGYLATVPRPTWAPHSTWVVPLSCDQLDPDGLVAEALGGLDGPYASDSTFDVVSGDVASDSQHLLSCSWSDDDDEIGLTVEILPGGGWAESKAVSAPGFTSVSLPMSRGSVTQRTYEDASRVADVFTDDGWFELVDSYSSLSDDQLVAAADALLGVISPVVAE